MLLRHDVSKFSKKSRLLVGLLSATAVISFGVPSYAQVDEIIVTARKTEESLQDVPIAVTAFTGDFLETSGLTEFTDIAKVTPNFDIREDGVSGSGFSTITIRGLSLIHI